MDVRDDKLKAALNSGATDVVNSSEEDPVKKIQELTEGRGVDIAFEALGRSETLAIAANSVRAGGRVVAIGLPTGLGATYPLEIGRLVRREVKLMGSYGGRPSIDMPELIQLVQNGSVSIKSAISRRYPLEKANDAFAALAHGEIIGRSIVEF